MRPLSIILEGFSAYRKRQTFQLADVEFFSLSGATGSGKSSLIDAMIFALYGRVPRLGARAVAPVITAGTDRARVSLEFETGGNEYVVSRVAERTDSGATVREARLETADGRPVASGAGEVTREVERLLRLRFEDFTKTVVLPQGEFARFLNAGSRERRELLRDLLGLDIYTQVRELANERRAEAGGRASSARGQLDSLDIPDGDEVDDARKRLAALEKLSADIGARLEELEHVEAALLASQKKVDHHDEAAALLGEVAAPQHLEEMNERLVAAEEAQTLAKESLKAKQDELSSVVGQIDDLPHPETITHARQAHEELAKLDERIAGLDVESAKTEVAKAEAAVTDLEGVVSQARDAAAATRVTHAAHTVAGTLVVGEACPVCARVVDTAPDLTTPPELDEVDEAVEAATVKLAAARDELKTRSGTLTEMEVRASELTARRTTLTHRVAETATLDQLVEAEKQLAALSQDRTRLAAEIEGVETALARACRDHDDAADAVNSLGRNLDEVRDRLFETFLRPPRSQSDDPFVRWKDFLVWRDQTIEALARERRAMVDEVDKHQASVSRLRESLVETLTSADVPAESPYDVSVARELEISRNRLERMDETIEMAKSLQARFDDASSKEAISATLANHLRANGFERWLMAGAISRLVVGANELLDELSSGGYALETDEDADFEIIDHRNADERRDVATLSGGETFLVSLALALSLAETLSAAGGAGLDAIILDEGFGTLDEESLDVVAAVLEELPGRGLMVGVITHVKELAARAPVRFQVTREPEGATVELVS